MSLHTLVYTSVALGKISDDTLQAILQKSRQKNTSVGITGMLLYMDPYFIQVLEGEEASISAAFDKIKQDPRHHKVSIIYKQPIAERLFGQWTMGFNKMTQEQIGNIDGLSDYLQRPTAEFFTKTPNKIFELLNLFRREILF